jgi:HKD family nuclease
MTLLRGKWEQAFRQLLQQTEHNILIISPFITKRASVVLKPLLDQQKLSCRVITRRNLKDFYSGVSDYNALLELVNAGAQVKSLKGLHAKVYTFDAKLAVLTSANLTGGGLSNKHEWGLLIGYEECPEIFEHADALWGRLSKIIDAHEVELIKEMVEQHRTKHPLPKIGTEDLLPDEGEDLQDGLDSEDIIRLKSTAFQFSIERALHAASLDSRTANAKDFRSLCDELINSNYRSISIRSFLWLVGRCNTGASWETFSKESARPLALEMFGYVPENIIQIDEQRVDLKDHRWKPGVQETLRDSIVAQHMDRLID